MYLEFYKLREFPFTTTCDSRFFFETPVHAEALANMLYTIQQCYGHDWKQRHQDQVGELLKNE